MAYAEVAICAARRFEQAFSYLVPAALALGPGDAVLVPFGAALLPGVVLSVADRPVFAGEIREVDSRIGDRPIVAEHQLRLAGWMAERYVAPLSAAVALMLPRGAREPPDFLPPSSVHTATLRLIAGAEDVLRALAALHGAVASRALRVAVALIDAGGAVPCARLRADCGLTVRVEAALVDAGLAELVEAEVAVTGGAATDRGAGVAGLRLTPDQDRAVQAIAAAMRGRFAGLSAAGVFLLHGVTGSGKTEVYLAALERARAHGRQGIVLVPEIALTPQTERRFAARFPGRVAVIHGRLSRARHRALWFGVRDGAYDVVVGARSALFAPLLRPGLIILDEEHEPAYKQSDPPPRYHARDVAAELARQTGAVLVLGSATPDLASYRRAQAGEAELLRLPTRVAAGARGAPEPLPLPALVVVDMARELREGNQNVLSRPLDAAIEAALAAGEQALLFLNRRGAASLLLCRDCGYAPRCPRCSVAYALHTAENRLVCHHCHHSRGVQPRCPQCRGARFRPVGIGTQRLEEIVRGRFPEARLLRWDGDSAGSQAKHAALATAVSAREVDIIIGTQMVAKGHDFGGITVVGVVSADLSLNIPDFRAAERTFQLLVQVAGRAGRRERPGKVFIQTYAPEHYAVRAAAANDYAALYDREAAFRRELDYPPFGALTRLVFVHSKEEAAQKQAERLAVHLRAERERLGLPGPNVVGPAPCYFSKLNGRWRWQILLRGLAARELLLAAPPPRGWAIDVDPVDVL